MAKARSDVVLAYLKKTFPDAVTALNFQSDYQCLVCIVLSAQATDKSVNLATPALFTHFPDTASLAKASLTAVEQDIKTIGLYHNKAKNIIALAQEIQVRFAGIIPHDKASLMSLPGVGQKTAGVFLMEQYRVPAIPVDTHVSRIAYRLGYCPEGTDPAEIEKRLEKLFPSEEWIFTHHALIDFGRGVCHAQKPDCAHCGLVDECPYFKKYLSTKGK